MKQYISPKMTIREIGLQNMMLAQSGDPMQYGGDKGGINAGQANGRRGTWGNLWIEPEVSEE